jgi:hypothetical protein
MAPALRPCILKAHAVGRQRTLPRQRHMATADHPPILNRLVGGATRARRHLRRARAGTAGDAVDARDLDGFGEGHICQDSGEAARQHRLACA